MIATRKRLSLTLVKIWAKLQLTTNFYFLTRIENFVSLPFFKTDTTKTDSLDAIKKPLHWTAINKFRLGNRQLHIETGRHTVPKTPEKLRICTLCQSNDGENESHALFSCALYNNFRSKFFDEITRKYKFFKDVSINSKILFLFNSIDPFICRSVAAFLFVVIMNYRYQTLSQMNLY